MTSKHLVPKWDRWDSDDEFDAEAAPPEPEEDLTAPPSAPWTDAESFPSMEDEEELSEEDEEEPKPVQFIHVQHTGWHANHSHIFQEPQQSMQGDAQAASAGDLADTCRPEPQSAGAKTTKWKPTDIGWHSRRHQVFVPNNEDGRNSIPNPAKTAFNNAKKEKKNRKAKEKNNLTRAEIRYAKQREFQVKFSP
jgi:hypothetical protein